MKSILFLFFATILFQTKALDIQVENEISDSLMLILTNKENGTQVIIEIGMRIRGTLMDHRDFNGSIKAIGTNYIVVKDRNIAIDQIRKIQIAPHGKIVSGGAMVGIGGSFIFAALFSNVLPGAPIDFNEGLIVLSVALIGTGMILLNGNTYRSKIWTIQSGTVQNLK